MKLVELELVPFPELGRDLFARPGTSDRRSIDDARTGRYHLPPAWMPVPRSVLDCGANIGATAAHYRMLWPHAKVVAVEPDPGNVEVLRMNTDAYVRTAAISTGFGTRMLKRVGLEAEAYRLDPAGELGVYCVTLDHAVGYDFGGDRFSGAADFVKLDVEGEEWALFEQGSWAPRVRHLLAELHGRDEPAVLAARALEALRGLGFAAERHFAHPAAVFAWREGKNT